MLIISETKDCARKVYSVHFGLFFLAESIYNDFAKILYTRVRVNDYNDAWSERGRNSEEKSKKNHEILSQWHTECQLG